MGSSNEQACPCSLGTHLVMSPLHVFTLLLLGQHLQPEQQHLHLPLKNHQAVGVNEVTTKGSEND